MSKQGEKNNGLGKKGNGDPYSDGDTGNSVVYL